MKNIKCQFYFSFRSPYAWLAWKILRDVFPEEITIIPSWNPSAKTYGILKKKGGDLLYVNMLKEKHMYVMHDIQRISKELNFELKFPIDTENPDWETIHLCYLYAADNNKGKEFMDIVFSARWESGMNIWITENIKLLLQQAHLDSIFLDDISWRTHYQEIAAEKLYEGCKHGVFGVPFFILGSSKYWGIERIIPLIKKWNKICDPNKLIKEKTIILPTESSYNLSFDHAGGCG